MRVNRFIALATGLSRRAADKLADEGEIMVNGHPVRVGREIKDSDYVTLNGKKLKLPKIQTIILNKPVGYVCSRDGQGSSTIYDLLPKELHQLKSIGRLDKDSSGLLLLTNDGDLSQKLTHPRYEKLKAYEVDLNRLLAAPDLEKVTHTGVDIGDDRLSRFVVKSRSHELRPTYFVHLKEGRSRQIRRTFDALDYKVVKLHRISFGPYRLGNTGPGNYTTA